MRDGSDVFIVICSFLAFSEIVTVLRSARSRRAPTGITPLGYVLPNATFVSKAENAGRYWREIAARSFLVVLYSGAIGWFMLRG